MRQINVTLEDDDFRQMKEVKGGRTWERALKEEFGVSDA
jgi:hypothetical protein